MKKIISSTICAAAVMAVAYSCTKDAGMTEGRAEVTLRATIELPVADSDSRTTLGPSNSVIWEVGDSISVVSASANDMFKVTTVGNPATSAVFKGALTEGASQYYAIYPYCSSAAVSSGEITLSVAQDQQYVAGSFARKSLPSVASFVLPSETLSFRNLFGVFKLSLSGSGTVTKISVTDNSGAMLWGKISLTANGEIGTAAQTLSLSDGNNLISLVNINETLSSEAKDFYFAVPAGSFANGFTAYVYGSDGITSILESNKDNTVPRATILKMPAVEAAAIKNMNLSSRGTANCYIAPGAGTYCFSATKGEGGATVTPDHVAVLWETINSTTAPSIGSIVSSVSCKNDVISLTTTGKRGNALIAAYDSSSKIVWSWHIWCSGEPVAIKKYTTGSKKMFLDRSIGALCTTPGTVECGGLTYQFGRKDPFPGAGTIGTSSGVAEPIFVMNPSVTFPARTTANGTFEYTNAHPTEFIVGSGDWLTTPDNNAWGNTSGTKTENDPCPYGYKVPVHTDMEGMNYSPVTSKLGAYIDNTEWVQFAAGLSAATGSGHNIGKAAYLLLADAYSNTKVYYLNGSSSKYSLSTSANRGSSDPIRCVKE